MILSKIKQTTHLLQEMNIDMWLLFCRETTVVKDPSLDLVVGNDISGQGAFFFTKSGDSSAYVWLHDAADIQGSGYFNSVHTYTDDFKSTFLKILSQYNPQSIAINFSQSSSTADGITYGMYLKLKQFIQDTPYNETLISAENLLLKLRSIKTEEELDRLQKAAVVADSCWHQALSHIKPGITERAIADILKETIHHAGYPVSFQPIVNAGTKSKPGHGLPTDATLEKGDLLHVDFGVKVDGYCSDIQRVAYMKKDNESVPPEVLTKAFTMVETIVDTTAQLYKVGAKGLDIDRVARKILTDNGYPEYQHSLGHQIGREVHDGGSRIGPLRDENDTTPLLPLDENNTFTVELGIALDTIGYMGLEEDLVVTKKKGVFLGPRQRELILI